MVIWITLLYRFYASICLYNGILKVPLILFRITQNPGFCIIKNLCR